MAPAVAIHVAAGAVLHAEAKRSTFEHTLPICESK
jgi:hypothetical protein